MGVPRHFPTSTENRTRLSYDNAYIQKIPKKTDVTARPSVAKTFKPTRHYYNSTNEGTDSYDRDKANIRKRFQELLNITDNSALLSSDVPWVSSINATNDYSSLYHIPLPTKIEVVMIKTPPWKHYLSVPTILFCVVTVLKLFVCYHRLQRRFLEEEPRPSVIDTDPQEATETSPPPAPTPTTPIIIDPAFSTQNNSNCDLPPSYSQCAANIIKDGNKIVENTSKDLPPPYSICVDALNATDDIPKIHKGQSVEEQYRTEKDTSQLLTFHR